MRNSIPPNIIIEHGFNERDQFEAKAKGYLSHVVVEVSDGRKYSVTFYDVTRLQQDLEYEVTTGRMCIAEVGMIVLPEVTLTNITLATTKLSAEGFFERLIPMNPA